MFVCSCKAITEARVRALGARGVTGVTALVDALGLDDPGCCGRCLRDLEQLAFAPAERRAPPLTWARVLPPGS